MSEYAIYGWLDDRIDSEHLQISDLVAVAPGHIPGGAETIIEREAVNALKLIASQVLEYHAIHGYYPPSTYSSAASDAWTGEPALPIATDWRAFWQWSVNPPLWPYTPHYFSYSIRTLPPNRTQFMIDAWSNLCGDGSWDTKLYICGGTDENGGAFHGEPFSEAEALNDVTLWENCPL